MEIQTNLTNQDLLDFNLYHLSHSPTAKRQRLIGLLPGFVLTGLWVGLSVMSDEPLRTFKALVPLFMPGPVYIVSLLAIWRWSIARQIQKHLEEGENRGVLGPHKIIISSDGVADIGELSQSTTQWKAVERVISTEHYAYIYVNALAAMVVPKRFFPNDAAFEEFVKLAEQYHNQAARCHNPIEGQPIAVPERQPPPLPPP